MDNLKNEIYENLGLSEDIQERIVDAMENAAKSNITPDTDNIRRKNSMRKNTHSDILNKVAVASLSLGLSGALIAGIITYTKDTSKSNIAKEAATTMSAKENADITNTESKPDKFYNSDDDIYEYSTSKTFKKVEFIVRTAITSRAKVGNSTIEFFTDSITDNITRVEINIKQGNGKFVNVDKIDYVDNYKDPSISAYGNALYYCDRKGLKKLDLKSLKTEYIMNFNDVDITTPDQELFAINDNYIYMSCKTGHPEFNKGSNEWSPEVDYMYCYNLKTKKLELIENKMCNATINDTYYITSKYVGTIWYRDYYLEKIEAGKVTTIKKFGRGDNAYFGCPTEPNSVESHSNPIGGIETFFDGTPVNDLTINGIMTSEANSQVFYYTSQKVNENGTWDHSEYTIMSYNLSTNKEEEIATITAKDINDPDNDFRIDIITDDYCDINHTPDEYDSVTRSRYYFKTGKVEKLN